MRSLWNRRLYVLHRWMGLAAGVVLLVVGISGVVIVFRDDLDRLQFGHAVEVPAGASPSADRAFAAALAARPAAHVYGSEIPDDPGRAWPFIYIEKGTYGALVVDPYRGRILAEYSQWQSASAIALFLHYTLLLSPWGNLVVAISGLVLLASGVTGVWIYRKSLLAPFRRNVRWRGGAQRLSKDLHVLLGVGALLFNLLMGFTGFWMMLYVFQPGFYAAAPDPPPATLPAAPLDGMLAAARAEWPDFTPRGLYLPAAEGEPVFMNGNLPDTPFWLGGSRGHGRSSIEFDAKTGAIHEKIDIRSASAHDKFETAVGELHFGQYGGLPVKIAYAIFGLTPGVLSLTGFVLWWTRRRRLRARAADPSAPRSEVFRRRSSVPS